MDMKFGWTIVVIYGLLMRTQHLYVYELLFICLSPCQWYI